MDEEEFNSEELQEAFKTVILFLASLGYTREQIMDMGPEEAYRTSSIEYGLIISN